MSISTVDDGTKKDMEQLVSEEYGINTFMCFMAGQDITMRDPELIEMFDTVSKIGGIAMVHAENEDILKEAEKKMMIAGISGPEGHAMAHPEEAEVTQLFSVQLMKSNIIAYRLKQ